MPVKSPETHVDYTLMENHERRSDPRDDPDPSNPQGEFWHQNERPGAESIKDVQLRRPSDDPETDADEPVEDLKVADD